MQRRAFCALVLGVLTGCVPGEGSYKTMARNFGDRLLHGDTRGAWLLTSAAYQQAISLPAFTDQYLQAVKAYGAPTTVSIEIGTLPSSTDEARSEGYPVDYAPQETRRAWILALLKHEGGGFEARLLLVDEHGQPRIGGTQWVPMTAP